MPGTLRSVRVGFMDGFAIHRVIIGDQAAGILRQQILDGELCPATALPGIPLATSFGVSRNTMREAVRILALEGLLKRNIHGGATVAQLSIKDVPEIYDLRRMIEVQVILEAKNRRPKSCSSYEPPWMAKSGRCARGTGPTP